MNLSLIPNSHLEQEVEELALAAQINVVDFSDFSNLEPIGTREFFKAKWDDCKTTVALKSKSFKKEDEFLEELKALISFQKVSCHPNILKFYGISKGII
ncbi:20307_t:CDS:2 [Cetraspora pellucida]|uniref:20307_t:CDS:1 n=1 Tax=Cetraspora pellucida TaxID=1433469 RepID=A0A9N9A8Y4_9GLOM|nr:20307_t:CDS:2 [Cetraspora pellucida]